MPFVDAEPLLVGGGDDKQNFFESESLVGGQSDPHVYCVHHPTKDHLVGRPCKVICIKILEGKGFLSMVGVQIVQQSEHLVQSTEKVVAQMGEPVGQALIQPKEIINKDVHIRQELGIGEKEKGV